MRRLVGAFAFAVGASLATLGLQAGVATPAFGQACPPTCSSTSIENNPCPSGPCGAIPNASPCPGGSCAAPSQASPCPSDPQCGKLEPAPSATPGGVTSKTEGGSATEAGGAGSGSNVGGTPGNVATGPGGSLSVKGKSAKPKAAKPKKASAGRRADTTKPKGFPAGSLTLTVLVCLVLTGVVTTIAGLPRRRIS